MAIKMRNNKNPEAVCCECGEPQANVLNMFDILIGNIKFTVCDLCNEILLCKCLKAECYKNGRIKSKQDLMIINKRRNNQG